LTAEQLYCVRTEIYHLLFALLKRFVVSFKMHLPTCGLGKLTVFTAQSASIERLAKPETGATIRLFCLMVKHRPLAEQCSPLYSTPVRALFLRWRYTSNSARDVTGVQPTLCSTGGLASGSMGGRTAVSVPQALRALASRARAPWL
jgi:hypothetical protein